MYQGHKNYSHWNQALYMANEHELYDLCVACVKTWRTLDLAAADILKELQQPITVAQWVAGKGSRTPDGVKWTKTGIRAALQHGAFSE